MPSQNISKLISRVRLEQKVLKAASIIFIVVFLLLVWRDFAALHDALERITEMEREDSPTSDIFRLWLLEDIATLYTPLGVLLLHILAMAGSAIAAIYFFAERKTQLLLALAEEFNKESEAGAGQPQLRCRKSDNHRQS